MAITYAKYRHGDARMVDYTPGSAVSAGDVVVTGDTPRVAHLDIAANELGALAAEGGIYEMPKATTSGSAIAADKKVYWDASAHVVTESSSSNKVFGVTVSAGADSDATILVRHDPSA